MTPPARSASLGEHTSNAKAALAQRRDGKIGLAAVLVGEGGWQLDVVQVDDDGDGAAARVAAAAGVGVL